MPTIQPPCSAVHHLDAGAGTPLVLLDADPGDARDFSAVLSALALPTAQLQLLPRGLAPLVEMPDSFLDGVQPCLRRIDSRSVNADAGVPPLRVAG